MIGQKDYVGTDIYEGDLLEAIAIKNPKTYECKYSIDRVSFVFQSGDIVILWNDFITHYGLKPLVKGNILEKNTLLKEKTREKRGKQEKQTEK
jgi:hypothetical protein